MGLPKPDPSYSKVNFSLKKETESKHTGEERRDPRSRLRVVKEVGQEQQNEFNHPKHDGTKNSRSNRFFYKVSNHQELFRIGRSFYEDFISGVKSFAISSTGYQTSQQKTILGLASFFDHKDDYKIAIISDNLDQGAFADIVSISKPVEGPILGDNFSLNINSFYNHFDFINLDEVLKLSNDHKLAEYDNVFDSIVDYYDLVFWDVPELHKIQLDPELYFPMIMKFESISIIVSKQITKQSDVDDLKKFFLGYGINMKGLLFEEKNSLEKKTKQPIDSETKTIKKRNWWKRFFN